MWPGAVVRQGDGILHQLMALVGATAVGEGHRVRIVILGEGGRCCRGGARRARSEGGLQVAGSRGVCVRGYSLRIWRVTRLAGGAQT